MSDSSQNMEEEEEETKVAKKYKYGIIYLSYIPEGLNVKLLREILSEFGQVGRIYLERGEEKRTYTEGWVEFKKKRVAKLVATELNGKPLQYGRKKCKFNGQIWSIKYLHRFKWAHLAEQLAIDKASREQKRRFEMSQVKKQIDFYQKMTERSRKLKKHTIANDADKPEIKQNRGTERGSELAVSVDENLLDNIFRKIS